MDATFFGPDQAISEAVLRTFRHINGTNVSESP